MAKATTTKKTPARTATKTKKQFKISGGAIIEIVLLAAELLNTLLPLPWRLILPFVLGIRLIVLKYRDQPSVMRVALVEGFFMTASILANFLPLPWRLIIPFISGVRSILIRYRHSHGGGKSCYCDNPHKSRK